MIPHLAHVAAFDKLDAFWKAQPVGACARCDRSLPVMLVYANGNPAPGLKGADWAEATRMIFSCHDCHRQVLYPALS